MFALEYLLLFGLPNNKLEFIDNRTKCRLPAATRSEAEAQFLAWVETLARWQGLKMTPLVERRGQRWQVEIADFRLLLEARVITAEVPVYGEAIIEFMERFWQPSRWPQLEGVPHGGSYLYQHSDVQMSLYWMLKEQGKRQGGWSSGKVDVVMSDATMAEPDAFYYGPDRAGCLVAGNYFIGPPDLAVEVLAPATAAWDRGWRRLAYARAGVPYFWIVLPQAETVETYELGASDYRSTGLFHAGESFTHPLFPGQTLHVTQMVRSRWGDPSTPPSPEELEREPKYGAAPDRPIGLQNLLLAGHPDRRYEILDGRTPCVVAFRSETEAEQRFREWAEEIGRWEGVAVSTGGDCVETTRFTLRRDGPRVALDIATSAATYRQLLQVYYNRAIWQEWHKVEEGERSVKTQWSKSNPVSSGYPPETTRVG